MNHPSSSSKNASLENNLWQRNAPCTRGRLTRKKAYLLQDGTLLQHRQSLQNLPRLDLQAFVALCFLCVPIPFSLSPPFSLFSSQKKHAQTYANAVNEHAASEAWTTGEPVLVWIPKKSTVDAIHAGVDATTDAFIQDWGKAQHEASSSSSYESTRIGEVHDENSKRKKSTKEKEKTTARITEIDDEDTNSNDSCEKPKGMKRKHNNAVDTEESDLDEAGNKIRRSPMKKLKDNETRAERTMTSTHYHGY